ncbi:hypothetical protein [Paenibacillus tengchongensis]|uniref:hypothetical protein n=1 Tax=Paenibacillus tengchongensis TaxID=2608684 RepID=UPI00124D99A0|nr:hypothetical protein [Paenibacillus tengchongensis]
MTKLAILAAVILILAAILIIRSCSIDKKLKKNEILRLDRMANLFGTTSRGYGQIRGNGWLILTERTVIFEMYVPVRQIVIPLNSITGINQASGHLGKIRKAGGPLLQITYRHGHGEETVAWSVNDVSGWIGELEKLRA